MILYGMRPSPYVRKVLFYAAEKGIEMTLAPGGFGYGGEAFEAASPFRKMPALVDGDFSICDSTAVIAYLEALHPEPAMIPADPRLKARTIWYEEFADTILFATGRKMFFNRVVAPGFLKIAGNQAQADMAEREELPPILDYLEGVAPEEGWLLGAFTLADMAVASPLVNIGLAGAKVRAERHPKLAAWLARVLARPAIAAVMEREAAQRAKAG